jgi:hypothetical protein
MVFPSFINPNGRENSKGRAYQSLAADGAIASFSSKFCSFSLNAARAPQLKQSLDFFSSPAK